MPPTKSRSHFISMSFLVAAGVFLIGLALIALCPPFEGVDEDSHFSNIREIEAAKHIPLFTRSFMSPEIGDYRRHGPMPYGLPIFHTNYEVDYDKDHRDGAITTYPEFFASPQKTANYVEHYRHRFPRPPYQETTDEFSWEAQHPPLYYAVMAPLMAATDGLPFTTQFLVLRLISFAMALAGFLIGTRATCIHFRASLPENYVLMGAFLYPLILPMFYPEFTRLSNDCLCVFLAGLSWHFYLRWLQRPESRKDIAALGIVGGLGLLTKLFFLPILAGYGLFAAIYFSRRGETQKRRPALRGFVIIYALALLIGGWWYLYQYPVTGTLSGSGNMFYLNHHGGLWINLLKNFSVGDAIHKILLMFMTWSWLGTQSLTFIGWPQAPLMILMVWIIYGYIRTLITEPFGSLVWLPAIVGGVYLAAMFSYALTHIAINRSDIFGWYLHVGLPVFATAAAYGLRSIDQGRLQRIILTILLIYAVLFLAVVFWAEACLFAGCALRSASQHYVFPGNRYCLDHIAEVHAHLKILSWPDLAAAAFASGSLCLLAGLAGIWRFLPMVISPKKA